MKQDQKQVVTEAQVADVIKVGFAIAIFFALYMLIYGFVVCDVWNRFAVAILQQRSITYFEGVGLWAFLLPVTTKTEPKRSDYEPTGTDRLKWLALLLIVRPALILIVSAVVYNLLGG